MPGTAVLRAYLSAVHPEQRFRAVNDLLDIGQVLWELTEDNEGYSSAVFLALPQEYQDWIQSLLFQILARLRRATPPRPSDEI